MGKTILTNFVVHMQQNNNINCDNYIVFNSVSGNNQIGFDLPVDDLKTGKVRKIRNTFPTIYGELDIFQVSLPHFTSGASWKYCFTRGEEVSCLEKGSELVENGGE
jgi:hypothetical protein